MIRIATKVARESKFERARMGAVVVRGGSVLSTGCNRIGFSKYLRDRKFDESVHAEAQAILGLLKKGKLGQLAGSTLYVSRINNSGTARYARPCLACQQLIESVGIRKVYYTTNTGVEEL